MRELAAELGVNQRTLHRHFASKADLVWGVVDGTIVRLRESLASAPASQPVVDAMRDAIIAAFDTGITDSDGGRLWIDLVVETPELRNAQADAIARWRDDLTAFAAARHPQEDGLAAAAIAGAVQSATLAALDWWAAHQESGTPSAAIARAIDALNAMR